MGAETGNNSGAESGLNDVIIISTGKVETSAGKFQDSFTALRNAAKPIIESTSNLSGINSSSDNSFSSQLQNLKDAQDKFLRNLGMLESSAVALRNIAITYDNAEQAITGGQIRKLVLPPQNSSGSGSSSGAGSAGGGTGKPGAGGPGADDKDDNSDEPSWEWSGRQWTDEGEDTSWYNAPFDKSGKLEFGKSKSVNDTEKGSYKNKESFSWNVGLNLGQREKGYEPLRDETTGKAKGEWKSDTKGDAPFAPQKCGTIAELYVEYGAEWTLAGAKTEYESDYIKYQAEAYALRAQANVHAGVGAFFYETPDGEIVNAYGLNAEVGASFTLAGASASGDAGSAYAGVSGRANVVVGDVYAKANATIGMVGGKFVAVASGAIGADAFRASAGGSVRLLGVEVGAEATFKVGVSAKFEVGFDGGKFKANIGAALGIGFEINISIDFSKAISVVKDAAKYVVEGAKAVGRAIGDAARAVGNWFRRW